MGINQWVQPESETINMTDIATVSVEQSHIDSTDIEPNNNEVASARIAGTVDQPSDGYDISDYNDSDYVTDEYEIDSQATNELTASEQSLLLIVLIPLIQIRSVQMLLVQVLNLIIMTSQVLHRTKLL